MATNNKVSNIMTTVPPRIEAKQLFLDRLTDRSCNNTGTTPFETIVSRALTVTEYQRRMTMKEGDVRQAVLACGFTAVPYPLRHNIRNREVFAQRTRDILCAFKADIPVTKEALRILSFVDDVLIHDDTTQFSTQQEGSKRVVTMDSPRGIRAQFFQTDWDWIDRFSGEEDDSDDDDESYVE